MINLMKSLLPVLAIAVVASFTASDALAKTKHKSNHKSKHDTASIFELADTDKDGKLSPDEFKAYKDSHSGKKHHKHHHKKY